MKSFSILRTNVGLTSNVKIMISSDYKLSLDSIDSNSNLSIDKYKKVSFNKNNFYDELIPHFYKGLPNEIAFQVKYNNDAEIISDDFKDQYDEIYTYGAKNILNNKNYSEEYEYFAPLYINKKNLPFGFIIFRVDGPGLGIITKENFKDEILKNFKTVKLFDMTPETPLGEWLDLNFTKNDYFPDTPLEIDFRDLEFCKWNGIDYKSGGYSSRSLFIDEILEREKEIFELEKIILDNYKNNEIVFPNILNLTFLFDDNPSTPEAKRNWSLNRYFGFYINSMSEVRTISPYIPSFLKEDVIIQEGNIIYSESNPGDPFLLNWSDNRPFYLEYSGKYYIVEKFRESAGIEIKNREISNSYSNEQYDIVFIDKYKIISDIDLSGKENDLNKNYGIINKDGILIDFFNNPITIDNFDSADVWLIEIDGIYHNIISTVNGLKVITDYSFNFNENTFDYMVAGVKKTINFLPDFNKEPIYFRIYKLNFTDIKDFDDRIIDTDSSRYEYEIKNELSKSDETKMYMENLLSNSNPREIDDFVYNNEVINIPVSSEYTANHETFKIENDVLSKIWRINPVHCRWSYQSSLSSSDFPYILNNSSIFEDYNRTTNVFENEPKRIERNLDYFYTINSSTSSYTYHSLHIENIINGEIDTNLTFDVEKYLNISTYSVGSASGTYSFDYFSYFFDRACLFENGAIKKNTKKYSEFNVGDNIIPNISLFRGIEFRAYDVSSIKLNSNEKIESINLKNNNTFEGYKLSILLSDNNKNKMSWTIIDEWKMDKLYKTGDIVIFNDILYRAVMDSTTNDPIVILSGQNVKAAPYNLTTWTLYNLPQQLIGNQNQPVISWLPGHAYSLGNIVYNYSDYYFLGATSGTDFWNPNIASTTGYSINNTVLYGGKYYKSTTSSNYHDPNYTTWDEVEGIESNWKVIEIWNPGESYTIPSYSNKKIVSHNNIVWEATISTIIEQGLEPGVSSIWNRLYSIEPDTDFIYKENINPIINMNGNYYLCNSNEEDDTLDNGVIIYINKKWKNILINLNISDNTLPNIKNTDRDELYKNLYKKLTANNFINYINDIDNKYDFTDYIKYVIISENGEINNYDRSNITALPYIIRCEFPDELKVKNSPLIKRAINKPNELKVSKYLNNGNIDNISKLNWYNNLNVGVEIIENEEDPKVFKNYNNNINLIDNSIYRFSGYYMPLFYDIQLFKRPTEYEEIGNYKFDTDLSDFGMVKERKIRKVNLKGELLKLSNSSTSKSIYPMVDEFGYLSSDFFIFKSSWDFEYYTESVYESDRLKDINSDIKIPTKIDNIGKS